MAVKVGIVGASGYGAAELVRLLQGHPGAQLTYLASESGAGKSLADVFPQFRGAMELPLEGYDQDRAVESAEVLFLAGHNGHAMQMAPGLLDAGRRVIDFSADFRLKDATVYERVYGIPHTSPHLLEEAVYGLVELNREALRSARLVAAPGCYPTAALLSIAPLLGARGRSETLIDPASLIVDAYSGVSGAGRTSLTLDYHFPEVNDSVTAYKVIGHRHTYEIEQGIAQRLGRPAAVTFTPHLAPMSRGILETTYATLLTGMSAPELRSHYQEFYREDPFVVVLPEGEIPRTGAVRGTNYVHLGVHLDPRLRRATIVTAEDNLVKGLAGQALQCMNLLCGFSETTGLGGTAVYP